MMLYSICCVNHALYYKLIMNYFMRKVHALAYKTNFVDQSGCSHNKESREYPSRGKFSYNVQSRKKRILHSAILTGVIYKCITKIYAANCART